jgi:hypothetical protein
VRYHRLPFYDLAFFLGISPASGAAHRGAVKTANKLRIGGANILRYIQCPRTLHIRAGRFITVRHNPHLPARPSHLL